MSAPEPGVSLTWLFDGIAALPANDVEVLDLTLDSREVRAGLSLIHISRACAWPND